jgi:hypothetical protein
MWNPRGCKSACVIVAQEGVSVKAEFSADDGYLKLGLAEQMPLQAEDW